MRVLRIEDVNGSGFMASLPSCKTQIEKELSSLIWSHLELLYCYRGGGIVCKNQDGEFILTEVEVLQLFLLFTLEKEVSHPFHFIFFQQYMGNIIHDEKTGQFVGYEFIQEQEFINAIGKRGFKLYYGEIEETPGFVLIPCANNDYEVVIAKAYWKEAKREYIPTTELPRVMYHTYQWMQATTNLFKDMKTNNTQYNQVH